MGGWIDGWVDRWMDKWMDGWGMGLGLCPSLVSYVLEFRGGRQWIGVHIHPGGYGSPVCQATV